MCDADLSEGRSDTHACLQVQLEAQVNVDVTRERQTSKWPRGGFESSWMDDESQSDESRREHVEPPPPFGPRQVFTPIPRGPLEPLLPQRFNSPSVFLDRDRSGYAVKSISLGTLDDRTFRHFEVEREVPIDNGKLALYPGARGGLDISGYGFQHSPAFHVRFLPGSVQALYFVQPGHSGHSPARRRLMIERVLLVISTLQTPIFRASVSARADHDETNSVRVAALDPEHHRVVPYLSRHFLVELSLSRPNDVFDPRQPLPNTFDNFCFDLAQLEGFPRPLDLVFDSPTTTTTTPFFKLVSSSSCSPSFSNDNNNDDDDDDEDKRSYSRRALQDVSTALGQFDIANVLTYPLEWILRDQTLVPLEVVRLVEEHVRAWEVTAGYDEEFVEDVLHELRDSLVEKRQRRFERFKRRGLSTRRGTVEDGADWGEEEKEEEEEEERDRFKGVDGEAEDARRKVIERRGAGGEGGSRLIATRKRGVKKAGGVRERSLEERGKRNLYWMRSVVVTPSGTIRLQGKSVEKTNSVIRSNFDGVDHFLRVAFKEEDGLVLSTVGGIDASFQHELVDGSITRILKEGLILGGRKFELLSYSQASLRDGAAVFLAPFPSSIVRNGLRQTRLIDAAHVRRSMGHFDKVARQPAMLGARWSQSFTTTSASVVLRESQIHEIPDISVLDEHSNEATCHTDGAGLLSPKLRDSICETLIANGYRLSSTAPYPSVFQFRLGGYKGVLAVDNAQEGIGIAVRRSQEKFSGIADDDDGTSFVLNIAEAFDRPRPLRLNRPLISALEDLGIDPSVFLEYQRQAVAALELPRDDRVFRVAHQQLVASSLGGPSGFQRLLKSFAEINSSTSSLLAPSLLSDEPFLRQALDAVRIRILRSYKYHASIPLPGCYLVVGVPDEDGTLDEDEVYLALRDPRVPNVVKYIEGRIAITRSPTVDAGDVRIVKVIGKLREEHRGSRLNALENCVVLPTKGNRSLSSMMGGGDLDGDTYQIITLPDLIPDETFPPAAHRAKPPITLDRPATIDDVADCFVHHLENNLVGSIATKHLFVSDKSPMHGRDPIALKLAELHSHSVDSPKTGQVVRADDLPHFPDYLRRERPDFLQGENRDYALDSGYYRSERALGQLYRDVDHEQIEYPELDSESPVSDSSSAATTSSSRLPRIGRDGGSDAFRQLRLIVEQRIVKLFGKRGSIAYAGSPPTTTQERTDSDDDEALVRLRAAFCAHLRDLAVVHSFPRTGGRRLNEVEIFAVTNLSVTTTRDTVARGNAVVAMGTQLESLVDWLERELGRGERGITRAREAWLIGAGGSEGAGTGEERWDDEFGVRTFRWICLSILLDKLDRLERHGKREEQVAKEENQEEQGREEEESSASLASQISLDGPTVSAKPPNSRDHSQLELVPHALKPPSPSPFPIPPSLQVPESTSSSYLNPRRLQPRSTLYGPRHPRSTLLTTRDVPPHLVRSRSAPAPSSTQIPLSVSESSSSSPASARARASPETALSRSTTRAVTTNTALAERGRDRSSNLEEESTASESFPSSTSLAKCDRGGGEGDSDPWQTKRLIDTAYAGGARWHHRLDHSSHSSSSSSSLDGRRRPLEGGGGENGNTTLTPITSRRKISKRREKLYQLRQRKGKINVSSGDDELLDETDDDDDDDDDVDGFARTSCRSGSDDETSDEGGMPIP